MRGPLRADSFCPIQTSPSLRSQPQAVAGRRAAHQCEDALLRLRTGCRGCWVLSRGNSRAGWAWGDPPALLSFPRQASGPTPWPCLPRSKAGQGRRRQDVVSVGRKALHWARCPGAHVGEACCKHGYKSTPEKLMHSVGIYQNPRESCEPHETAATAAGHSKNAGTLSLRSHRNFSL